MGRHCSSRRKEIRGIEGSFGGRGWIKILWFVGVVEMFFLYKIDGGVFLEEEKCESDVLPGNEVFVSLRHDFSVVLVCGV